MAILHCDTPTFCDTCDVDLRGQDVALTALFDGDESFDFCATCAPTVLAEGESDTWTFTFVA